MSLRLLLSINIKATLYYIIHRFLDSKYRAISDTKRQANKPFQQIEKQI